MLFTNKSTCPWVLGSLIPDSDMWTQFYPRSMLTQNLQFVLEKQVLLTTLTISLQSPSVSESLDSDWATMHNTGTLNWSSYSKWNSAFIHFIIYTCCFLTVTYQNKLHSLLFQKVPTLMWRFFVAQGPDSHLSSYSFSSGNYYFCYKEATESVGFSCNLWLWSEMYCYQELFCTLVWSIWLQVHY